MTGPSASCAHPLPSGRRDRHQPRRGGYTIADNTYHDFILHVLMSASQDVGFRGMKVYSKLQVSPAPGGASFNDVPTSHPFFQYIEALKAAGITGGCSASPPLYCPDSPVTRGQMAVFLAKAFGLRWPG